MLGWRRSRPRGAGCRIQRAIYAACAGIATHYGHADVPVLQASCCIAIGADNVAAMTRPVDATAPVTAIPAMPRLLGFAGLLPQIVAVALLVGGDPQWRFVAVTLAYAYAALIFTFLGGMWWGLAAAAARETPGWVWIAAVLPSLIALASGVPWLVGQPWPQPSTLAIGAMILASPLVDARLAAAGLVPRWWLRLRVALSAGLGTLTVIAGLWPALPGVGTGT